MVAQSKRALETDDKKNQKKFHGFIAGVTSGVTKLAVGHPFGMQREWCWTREGMMVHFNLSVRGHITHLRHPSTL